MHPFPGVLLCASASSVEDAIVDRESLPTDFIMELEATAETYLSHTDPILQSGFGGGAERWRAERAPILDGIDRSGSLIDVGCANGHLLEGLVAWAHERSLKLEPYGVDYSPKLIDLARRRLPQWADRFFVGNAWEWLPPQRFDFVYSIYDNVPETLLAEYVRRLLTRFAAPGGRVILGSYGSRTKRLPAFDLAEFLARADLPIAGHVTVGMLPEARFVWVNAAHAH
jgi:ubiquinone/menaquinone biosynthesis C-methylase UbiE